MANEGKKQELIFQFDLSLSESCTDNCATHHICNDLDLYVDPPTPVENVGIKGVSGSAKPLGEGTIQFKLLDDEGVEHLITLDKVLYLPSAPKNLISVSQWASDRKDNCGVTSRENHSVFMWGNDKLKKTIIHNPRCKIPLMMGNKVEDKNIMLAHKDTLNKTNNENDDNDSDKQSGDLTSASKREHKFKVGTTVMCHAKKKPQVCIITEAYRVQVEKPLRYKIRPLNSEAISTVGEDELKPILPDPSDIPLTCKQVDKEILTQTLGDEQVRRLWNPSSDSTVKEA